MRQKLFTKQIDDMLFKQYAMGNELSKQKVVAKIFNPYGSGTFYLLNSDPSDPDYIWAIVDLFEIEVGSVSRESLETMKVPPFGLNLERDIYFQPINASELLSRLYQGETFANGGELQIIKNESGENYLANYDSTPNEMAVKLANGGSIPNNYRGRTTEDIWNSLTENQRVHFMFDHFDELGVKESEIVGIANQQFQDLNEDVQDAFKRHTMMGQYADGGEIGGLDVYESVLLYVKRGLKQPFREEYLSPIGLHNTEKAKEVEASLKKKGYINSAGAINELGKNKAKQIDESLDYAISRGYLGTMRSDRKQKFEILKEKFENKMADGGMVNRDLNLYAQKRANELGVTRKDLGYDYSNALAQALVEGLTDANSHSEVRQLISILEKRPEWAKDPYADKSSVPEFGSPQYSEWRNNSVYSSMYYDADENVRELGIDVSQKSGYDGYGIAMAFKYIAQMNGEQKLASNIDKVFGGKMAKGGTTTFNDKVKSIAKSLLKRKKVSPKVQKDYGKTYDKKEAVESAKRIAGAMIKKKS